MNRDHFLFPQWGIALMTVIVFICRSVNVSGQKAVADNLEKLLAVEKQDSNRIKLMWQMAGAMDIYDPNRALLLSQTALYLSKEIKYTEGQSKSLGALANTFVKLGNYPRAVSFYLEKLKLEEQRDAPRNLASVLMNLGVVYVLQEDYKKALEYYAQSDSVIRARNVEDMKYFILLNLGDVYNRLNQSDSAYQYFSRSLAMAKQTGNVDLIGSSMTGLGHSYFKKQDYKSSQYFYQHAIANLRAANDDEILCEATLGIATLFDRTLRKDSARIYGLQSLTVAKQGRFLSHQLAAAKFLTNHYREDKNIDSAYLYLDQSLVINDSINSKSRIRESQILSTNEQLRQLEIKENKKIAARQRAKQLQLLFIGIFVPGFFLFTLSLSRIKINIRIIKTLGVLSMIIFFEYLTLLMHPFIGNLTHHIPVLEMLVFVTIAVILIPIHHRIEHLVVERLMSNHALQQSRMKARKVKQRPPLN